MWSCWGWAPAARTSRATWRVRALGGRHRGRAGGRGVPVLGVRPVEDDDPRRRPAGRGPPDPRRCRQVERVAEWAPFAARIRAEATDDWDDTVAVDRFVEKGGTVRAWPRSARRRRHRSGRRSCVSGNTRRGGATGSPPAVPPIPGLAATPFWTNHHAIEAAVLPASIVVLGGGAIGAELAQVYARFDVEVDPCRGRGSSAPSRGAGRRRRTRRSVASRGCRCGRRDGGDERRL